MTAYPTQPDESVQSNCSRSLSASVWAWAGHVTLVILVVVWLVGAASQSQAAKGAKPFVPKPTWLATTNANVKQGLQLMASGKTFEACRVLGAEVDKAPKDMHIRGYYAIALIAEGRYLQGREQMSMVLSWMPTLVNGYVARATAAAKMGNVRAAERDIALARQLDPTDKLKIFAIADKAIADANQHAPNATPAALHAQLETAAREGESLDKLIARAKVLVRASNAFRVRGDETYSEQRRKLTWAMMEKPNDADRIAALGRFIYDDLDVRGDYVDPTQTLTYFRIQGKVIKQLELDTARALFNRALEFDPNNEQALLSLPRMEYTRKMYANAEVHIRRVLASGKPSKEAMWFFRDLAMKAASENIARAFFQRKTYTWTEKIGNYIYEYRDVPTLAELRHANQIDGLAHRWLAESRHYVRQAIETMGEDAASYDFGGCMSYRLKDYKSAKGHWEKAIQLDPNNREYRYSLANTYARLNMVGPYLATATYGRGLEHTSAGAYLHWAWEKIVRKQWAEASIMLKSAAAVDAGDPRTFAYRGAMAEGQGNAKEALAMYRAALAMEEAHAVQRGSSWLTGLGSWYVNDLGRAMELKMRIGAMIEATDPKGALELYLQGTRIDGMIGNHAMVHTVHNAMLPETNLSANTKHLAPMWGELMRTNRAMAARALSKLGRHAEAAEHFNKLTEYDARARAGGGKAFNRLRDRVWSSPSVANAAATSFAAMNNPQAQAQWNNIARRAAREAGRYEINNEPTRHIVTQTDHTGGRKFRR